MVVEVHENETLPSFDANGEQAVLRAVEILHAVELGHAFERAIEAVIPAMIRTMQHGSLSAGLSDNGGGVVTADVVEGAENVVVAANYNDRFTGHRGGHKLTRRLQLVRAGDELPAFAEHIEAFQFGDAGIHVPWRRNGGSLGKRRMVVVTGENLLKRCLHGWRLSV